MPNPLSRRWTAVLVLGAVLSPLAACDGSSSSAPDPPGRPTGLAAEPSSTSAISLSWSAPAGTEEIEVERARGSGSFARVARVDGATESYEDRGLQPGTSYRYRIRACGAGGCSAFTEARQARTHEVLAVVTEELPAGIEGEPYEVDLEAAGGDDSFEWSLADGALPEGLVLDLGGRIRGTPSETGSFEPRLAVTSGDGQRASRRFALEVHPLLRVATDSLPDAVVGERYAEGLSATGGDGTYGWVVAGGGLPAGLSLAPEGVISGTAETEGTSTFTARVTSGDAQTAEKELTLTVTSPPGPGDTVSVATEVLPPGVVGGSYDVRLRAGGDTTATIRWSVVWGSLPDGLVLESSGRIHGTPTRSQAPTFSVRAAAGEDTATATLQLEIVADDTDSYDLTDLSLTEVSAEIRRHVDQAVARWETAITDDLPAVTIPPDHFRPGDCGGFGEVANGTTVEDVLVMVNIRSIDGEGQVLGQAGPCTLRDDTLPAVGLLTLDRDDLQPLAGTQRLTDLIFHELGHVLGFGGLWEMKGLVDEPGADSVVYTGSAGVSRYQELGGEGEVPVENDGGRGTAGVHWEESVFDAEIMTGFSEQVGREQPLSTVSIGAMQDLGYGVNFDAADPYSLDAAAAASAPASEAGYDLLYRGPLRILPQDARVDAGRDER